MTDGIANLSGKRTPFGAGEAGQGGHEDLLI